MKYAFVIKGFSLIVLLTIISALNDIPYFSRIVPYLMKNQTNTIGKYISFGKIDFSPINGIITINKFAILNKQKKTEFYAEKAILDISVSSLMKNEGIEISSVKVFNAKMRYEKLGEEKSNFSYLFEDEKAAAVVKNDKNPKTAPQSSRPETATKFNIKNIEFFNSSIDFSQPGERYVLNDAYIKIDELSHKSNEINIYLSCKILNGSLNTNMKIYQNSDRLDFAVKARGVDIMLFKKYFYKIPDFKIYSGSSDFDINGVSADDFNYLKFSAAAKVTNCSFDLGENVGGFRDMYLNISNFDRISKSCDIETLAIANSYFKYSMYADTEAIDTMLSETLQMEALPSDIPAQFGYAKQETTENERKPIVKNDGFSVKQRSTDTPAVSENRDSEINLRIKYFKTINSTLAFEYIMPFDTMTISLDNFSGTSENIFKRNGEWNFYSTFNGRVNGAGVMTGYINYKGRRALNMDFNISNLSLPNFNPYFKEKIGHIFEFGKFDISNKTMISDSSIISMNKIIISNPEAVKINNKLEAPLKFALNKLKNKKGLIELDFPITGNLDDMEFSYSKAMWKIAGKTLITPFTFLFRQFESCKEEDFSISYKINSSILSDDAKKILDDIAGKIKNEKKYTIHFDYATTKKEIESPGVVAMYKKRIKTAEKYFAETHGIDVKRILYKELRTENIKTAEDQFLLIKVIR